MRPWVLALALGLWACSDADLGGSEQPPADTAEPADLEGEADVAAEGLELVTRAELGEATDGDVFAEPDLPEPADVPVAQCPWSLPVALPPSGGAAIDGHIPPGIDCALTVSLDAARVLSLRLDTPGVSVAGVPLDEARWSAPRSYPAGPIELTLRSEAGPGADVHLTIEDLGPPPVEIVREDSLVWTTSPLVDLCDLACLMAAIAWDGHGGALFQDWFLRFATTAHSERLGPTLMLESYAAALGPDPTAWDLSVLPFIVTGVHNRFDRHNATHCGELRVSLASTDPLHKPFHLIFLFAMPPLPGDASPSGALHCTATTLWWARLGALTDAERLAAATERVHQVFTAEHFLAAESLEFLVSPWEWRQWFLTGEGAEQRLENRPLFQTVDIPRLNAPGADRDAFLDYVASNAEALRERRAELPEAFRSPSARLNQGVPWIPLDLSGLPATAGDVTMLRQAIEQIGCPGCHTADAPFVQTDEERLFSPFYDKELDARAVALKASASGPTGAPPFGPLQTNFVGH